MAKKTVALSVEDSVYDKYKAYCENKMTFFESHLSCQGKKYYTFHYNKKGIILSKQVELFMEQELKKVGEKNESK
ncbi:MAG: hypothetical protein HZB65_04235 [Candidatus Aenigmarchaeota archaeon]|nr:hypothetical protein [Candidatus Aenigmarchaeota archaeon]